MAADNKLLGQFDLIGIRRRRAACRDRGDLRHRRQRHRQRLRQGQGQGKEQQIKIKASGGSVRCRHRQDGARCRAVRGRGQEARASARPRTMRKPHPLDRAAASRAWRCDRCGPEVRRSRARSSRPCGRRRGRCGQVTERRRALTHGWRWKLGQASMRSSRPPLAPRPAPARAPRPVCHGEDVVDAEFSEVDDTK